MDTPQKLSGILTSVGLEVEDIHSFGDVNNSLNGLLIGEVITCIKHSDADKLKITTVNNGHGETL
jgi:phenylalanyl-tRNA synthetase beta chain